MPRALTEPWFPVSCLYFQSGKIADAVEIGGVSVILAHLYLIAKARMDGGRDDGGLPLDVWDKKSIGRWGRTLRVALGLTENDIEIGMNTCLNEGLAEVVDEGETEWIRAHDYEAFLEMVQREAVAARKRATRAQKKDNGGQRDTPGDNGGQRGTTGPMSPNDIKEIKERKGKEEPPDPSTWARATVLADLLAEEIHKERPRIKLQPSKWVDAIDRMLRLDKIEASRIEKVILWATHDCDLGPGSWKGWGPNIRSGAKLREKFDRLEEAMEIERRKAERGDQRGLALEPIEYDEENN